MKRDVLSSQNVYHVSRRVDGRGSGEMDDHSHVEHRVGDHSEERTGERREGTGAGTGPQGVMVREDK